MIIWAILRKNEVISVQSVYLYIFHHLRTNCSSHSHENTLRILCLGELYIGTTVPCISSGLGGASRRTNVNLDLFYVMVNSPKIRKKTTRSVSQKFIFLISFVFETPLS